MEAVKSLAVRALRCLNAKSASSSLVHFAGADFPKNLAPSC
ncbi:hypothetical protein XMG7_002609 [Aliiroseovarius sp. xm-g-7]|nr:hypothetical protein [Aliiroseovarius sp. xm-g-7]